jgi:hypothetical protein
MVDALATWLLSGLSRFFAQASKNVQKGRLHRKVCKVEDCTTKCAKWKIAHSLIARYLLINPLCSCLLIQYHATSA